MHDSSDRDVFLSTRPATGFDRKLSALAIAVSTLIFVAIVPFASVRLPAVPAFVSSYQFALATSDLITAVLFYVQFNTLHSRALLLLAGGYLFTAGMAIAHALTFPDLFAPAGLFGAGSQTTVWLYMLWHGGFPILALGYALLKDEDGGAKVQGPVRKAIAWNIVAVVVTIVALLWGVTGGHAHLPTLLSEGRYTATMIGVVTSVWLLSLATLIALWSRRPHSTLDVWLMVVMSAWLFDIALSAVLNEARFDVGFYAGRIYGLFAANFVLAVLLVGTGALHTQLSRLLEAVRQQAASETRLYKERERLFSAVVESSNDAIITNALDGAITGWNRAAERLFGFDATEAVGNRIDIIVPSDRRLESAEILRRTEAGEVIQHFETQRMRRDGGIVDVSLSVSPIRSESGAIVGASKTARDVTESKRAQKVLRQQNEERQRIFETSQDLILVTDTNGSFVQVSPSSEAILGYPPEDMVGHSAVDFVHPDDLDSTRAEMRSARRGKRICDFEARYFHKDGRIVTLAWMGTWSEQAQRHFFIGRDMTASRKAQEALLESEQLARGIIDTALDGFIQMNDAGLVTDWNFQAETIFGWRRDEVLNKALEDLIIPVANRASPAGLSPLLQTGEGPLNGKRMEIDAVRRDGREIRIELGITALRQRSGVVLNAFVRDLTEKIAAEDRLRQAEKMEAIGQLTGGVAHDFNNILTVITGTIELLAEAVEEDAELADIARMIDQAANKGAELTQRLLSFARKQPLQPRETDVNTLLADTAKLLRPTLGEHIEIKFAFEDHICSAMVDPNQLATAILNLALNARDAMPDGGKLFLETGDVYLDESYAKAHNEVQPGRYILIAVSDTGTGIPKAIVDKVFDPFFTSKGAGKGTGLGLSMVYGFVKQSAGHIKIYSEEGHGTTIKIYLPPGAGASPSPEISPAGIIEGGHETVLIVEDDALVRNYVVTQLRVLGYETLPAASAREALAIVDANPAMDLLFTDVIMPGLMNGRQLADELRKRRPSLKVLFTSGYTENAIIHHGRLDPGVLLLPKPYRKSDLARMVRQALKAVN